MNEICRLEGFIAEFNIEAKDLCEQLLETGIPEHMRVLLLEIDQVLGKFDFELAAKLVVKMKGKLNIA